MFSPISPGIVLNPSFAAISEGTVKSISPVDASNEPILDPAFAEVGSIPPVDFLLSATARSIA